MTEQDVERLGVVVAERDGEVVGFYGLHIDGDTAELTHVFVDPPAIGTGVGRTLWQHSSEPVPAAAWPR